MASSNNSVSSRSHRSTSNQTRSYACSSRSSQSKKIELASEAAALKSRLKFLDAVSQKQLELNKLEAQRDLEIAEAKLDVIEKFECGSTSNRFMDSSSRIEYVKEYVESLAYPQALQHKDCESTQIINAHPSDSVNNLTHAVSMNKGNSVITLANKVASNFENIANSANNVANSVNNVECVLNCVDNAESVANRPTVESDANNSMNNVNDNFWLPVSDCKDYSVVRPAMTLSGTNQRCSRDINGSSSSAVNPLPQEDESVLRVARVLSEHIGLSRLPRPEPGSFSGDPLKFPQWKSAFETLIDSENIPANERMYYLKRYLSGPAKDCVENYFLLSSDDAYENAKKLLQDRFGNSFVIANAFRDKLEAWPKIHYKDGIGLRKLSDFMRQCQIAMQSTDGLRILNDERENMKILRKLPDHVVSRWSRTIHEWRTEKLTFPSFAVFVKFLEKEANILCDPVTSTMQLTVKDYNSQRPYKNSFHDQKKQTGNASTFSTTSTEYKKPKLSDNSTCVFCNGTHLLDNCSNFLKRSVEERKKFVSDTKLCFGCLKSGHFSRFCRGRMTCNICKQFHPTALHGDVRDSNVETTSATSHNCKLNACDSVRLCSMILPVWISLSSQPEREVLVYALLDTQSDSSFISDATCDTLGVDGTSVQLILSTMYSSRMCINSRKIKDLVIRGHNSNVRIYLNVAYSREEIPANRNHIPTPEIARKWTHLERIADELMPLNCAEVGLLIGYNCSRALIPREVICPVLDEPFGQKTDLGWVIVGNVNSENCEDTYDGFSVCHKTIKRYGTHQSNRKLTDSKLERLCTFISLRTQTKEVLNAADIVKILEKDFSEIHSVLQPYSREDKLFLDKMTEGIHLTDGHYEMPLPFKTEDPVLPNNRDYALLRMSSLRKRFAVDDRYRENYYEFMTDIINKGYAERVPADEINANSGHIWYIPHHGVYHPKKPDKIRVVFGCNSVYKGHSINDHLLKGPDLTNALTGVLCRFRKENIAVCCDIEQMFYQFRVNQEHRDYLRFLWWDGSTEEPVDFRMKVHLFGAGSSPACANFGLKQAAIDYEEEFGSNIANFLKRDFYVDDGLRSLSSEEAAIDLIHGSKNLLAKCGIRLHKFISNSKAVVDSVPVSDRAKDIRDIDLCCDELPTERILGMQWCIESDSFCFSIIPNIKPATRRGILSTVCSIYDPLGLISPFILLGKQILQELCRLRLDWDSSVPHDVSVRWEDWRENLIHLSSVKISRCFKPKNFGEIIKKELHFFSDASTYGYGQCTYLRLLDNKYNVHCSLVFAKSRVTPLKQTTIPRLELAAALLSVRVGQQLKHELEIDDLCEYYWTDSKVVLGYICNDARRFQTYVANRVQQIRDFTLPEQWRYISSSENPADAASRGLQVDALVNQSQWFSGPKFLWNSDFIEYEVETEIPSIETCDPEVRKGYTLSTTLEINTEFDLSRFEHISSWFRLKRSVALCLRLSKRYIKDHSDNQKSSCRPLTVENLQHAELVVIKLLQSSVFKEEIARLKDMRGKGTEVFRKALKKKSSLYKLDPFLDENDVLRVGGRLSLSGLGVAEKNPVIFPKKHHLTTLLIRHVHEATKHQGKGITTNELRSSGYWILGCSSAVSSHIFRCIVCRKLRGKLQEQKMSNLPEDRLLDVPPFTYCGVDCFGPWTIKEGRSERKRYGVLYTCLNSRAVHLEVAHSLSTDSFLNSLRRFIAIRGPMRHLRCDNGTNFVGAKRELQDLLLKIDHNEVKKYLLENGCDFVFKMNVPTASHAGGVWERQIRSIRSVLSAILLQSGSQLDDESLRTFMYESAAIVNSRPLTVDNLNDVTSLAPLTPNHLLTMKSGIILPPPSEFQKEDVYSRKRWRRVQYLTNVFWSRWKREYLQNLQTRAKWNVCKREICVGDIVLLMDDSLPRNQWSVCRVVETYPSGDNHVRKVKLVVGNKHLTTDGKLVVPPVYLQRPIQKLVLLLGVEDQGDQEVPRRGATT